jgi:hypothetical protein
MTNLYTAIGQGKDLAISSGLNKIASAIDGITSVERAISTATEGAFGTLLGSLSRAILPISSILDALGWVGQHAAELQSGASAIRTLGDSIAAFVAKIRNLLPSFLFGGAATAAPSSSGAPGVAPSSSGAPGVSPAPVSPPPRTAPDILGPDSNLFNLQKLRSAAAGI